MSALFIQPTGGSYPNGTFSLSTGGSDNRPFGSFGVSIDNTAGNGSGNAYYGDLEFDVTRTGGLSVASFVANERGWYFSADLTDGESTGAQAWKVPVTTKVPETTSLALLGLGLVGLGLGRRRRA